ncbi:fic family toxin-antitoxin system, toxin component [Streptomyces cinnamoneus]|uniref:Fic family toxin-antitoxin system, toxin component n=1 Tax=Streptomyces cinnamoneus TaxID=53446 RepID=A0A2G1XII7_STRCJ|nr:fic family toxin-antitoxin system, toxin component [Streptomyces cinnamoneus]PHQ51072.1 fic family toxin-antitoxin system, toxin component [Streptomyces cinnamoneus]PPT13705.1 fic family toxin-antitoxin system, toxin component [Streptomyces cinnamoneus]
MTLHVDLSWLLEAARLSGNGDPAPEDYGVPIAAVERHKAVLAGQDVYHGVYARAGALVHTLGRLPWLERSNLRVAVGVAQGYLGASGIQVKLTQERVTALAIELKRPASTAASVAAVLRGWDD